MARETPKLLFNFDRTVSNHSNRIHVTTVTNGWEICAATY